MQYWSKRVVDICTSYLAITTQYLDSWLSDLLQSELKMKLLKVEGDVPQCPIAGNATVMHCVRGLGWTVNFIVTIESCALAQ